MSKPAPSESNLFTPEELEVALQKVLSTSSIAEEAQLQKFKELKTFVSTSIAEISKELSAHKMHVKEAFALFFVELGKKHGNGFKEL